MITNTYLFSSTDSFIKDFDLSDDEDSDEERVGLPDYCGRFHKCMPSSP